MYGHFRHLCQFLGCLSSVIVVSAASAGSLTTSAELSRLLSKASFGVAVHPSFVMLRNDK